MKLEYVTMTQAAAGHAAPPKGSLPGSQRSRRRPLFFALAFCVCALLPLSPLYAQEAPGEDFWIGPSAETAMYSISGLAYGGGLAFGYGSGVSIGLKGVYLIDLEKISTVEVSILLRFYLLGPRANSGPFIQISGGPALFKSGAETIGGAVVTGGGTGMVSGGLGFGWRFLLGKYLYIEPAVRAGYPYFAGGGVTAGVHF